MPSCIGKSSKMGKYYYLVYPMILYNVLKA